VASDPQVVSVLNALGLEVSLGDESDLGVPSAIVFSVKLAADHYPRSGSRQRPAFVPDAG